MPDLQVANAGTVETKIGFLVPPITINVPGWDDLTGKTIRLEIYSCVITRSTFQTGSRNNKRRTVCTISELTRPGKGIHY